MKQHLFYLSIHSRILSLRKCIIWSYIYHHMCPPEVLNKVIIVKWGGANTQCYLHLEVFRCRTGPSFCPKINKILPTEPCPISLLWHFVNKWTEFKPNILLILHVLCSTFLSSSLSLSTISSPNYSYSIM